MASIFSLAFTQIVYLTCYSLCEGLRTVNCNVENSSTLLLSCRSYEQIFINSIFYHQPVTECGGTGSCKKRYRTDDPHFSPICQYVYGDCNQPLNSTVLDYCRKDNLTVAAEVDYNCRLNHSGQGIYSVQKNGSNTSAWIADIFCPPQTFIYIESVVYWKLKNDPTCQSKTWTIPGEELRLNNLCIKQQQCQPSLLYNISTLDGCKLEWPNLGAEVNYRCIEEAVDICSDIVRISNDSLTTLYLTSPTPTSTMPSSCHCQVDGNEMEVRVLYLNFPAMTSVIGDLYFTPVPVSFLNLTTPIFNTRIFNNISDVTVTFDDKNPTQQHFLIEFKELKNYSFLQLTCHKSENNMPVSSMFTYTTVRYGELQEREGVDGVLIGIIVGSIILVIGIIMLIILLLRKRKSATHKKDINSKYAHSNEGFQEHSYFEMESGTNGVTRPYSLATDPRLTRASSTSGRPESGYEAVEPNGISKIRVRSNIGTYEDIDLRDLVEKDDIERHAQSYSQYADIDEFNNSSLIDLKGAKVVMPSYNSLCIPKSDKVEYAKVNKLKKRTKDSEMTPNIEIRLNGLPLSEVTAPPIPEKHLTEEEKNAVSSQKC